MLPSCNLRCIKELRTDNTTNKVSESPAYTANRKSLEWPSNDARLWTASNMQIPQRKSMGGYIIPTMPPMTPIGSVNRLCSTILRMGWSREGPGGGVESSHRRKLTVVIRIETTSYCGACVVVLSSIKSRSWYRKTISKRQFNTWIVGIGRGLGVMDWRNANAAGSAARARNCSGISPQIRCRQLH